MRLRPYAEGMAATGRRRDAPSAIESSDPPRNFTISTEERIRALSIGAPAYAERKKRIEDAADTWRRTLVDLHDALSAAGQPEATVREALRKKAATFDFTRVNVLVEKHNRYFPIEANLAMDRNGDYLLFGRPWRREQPFDAERLVREALEEVYAREE